MSKEFPLKRFITFSNDTYYPGGGWSDFRGSYDTLEEAMARKEELDKEYDYAEVIDTQTGEEY